jgi:hypothetical protein
MSVDLWFYEDYIDEEDDKIMFDILVCELFAFVLQLEYEVKGNTH